MKTNPQITQISQTASSGSAADESATFVLSILFYPRIDGIGDLGRLGEGFTFAVFLLLRATSEPLFL